MQVQDEKIKGFNILELIIVVVIIGVISAVGYPNFSEWRKDRLVRSDVIKIRSLIEGINSQVQRGQYAFVQVDIKEGQLINGEDGLIVTSKGMKSSTIGALLNNGESDWWQNPNNRCNIADQDYWDEDPDPDRNQVIDLDKIEVRQIILENVATTWRDEIGAVCFGKNDQWYSGNGQLVSGTDDVIVDNFLFICNRSKLRSECDLDNVTGEPITEHDNLYVIEWSRFGNITYERFNNVYTIDPEDGKKEWAGGNWVAQ